MSVVARLGKKSVEAVKNGGVKHLAVKTKNYLTFQYKKHFGRDEMMDMRDILFISGCDLPHPERYRVDHQIEQLAACGLTADKISYTHIIPDKIRQYRAVIVFRCPITKELKELIELAHYYNKRVFYDIDDLVIDTKYTDKIEYIQQMDAEERKSYDEGVRRMGETLKLCDYCITTTGALARELEKYGKEVFVNRNVASEEMVKLSLAAVENTVKDGKVRIGYLSGSITHNPDFELVKPAIKKVMEEFPEVVLVLMGHLDLPEDLEKYRDRIERLPFVDYKKLPDYIAKLDINLAPIEKTIFNEAKSENKWMEAALCSVATVASDYGAFKEVIRDGKTGVLCDSRDEWYKRIKWLVENPEKRQEIAENAHDYVMKKYVTTYTGLELAKFIKSKLAKNIAFVVILVDHSGGANVILNHCDILRRRGWDVTIIETCAKKDNEVEIWGNKINAVSSVNHPMFIGFDKMVATFNATLDFVKAYPRVREKMYLVQNFETDFYNHGDTDKMKANATYLDETGVRYLTISKWCQGWLKGVYGQNAKYAPNGIKREMFRQRERDFSGKVKILIEGNAGDYYKNVDESFKIVDLLDRDKYEVVFLSYRGEAKEWYKYDKLYQKVSFEEVGKIYRECDILLKTSILESFSYPPLEMMATGGYVVVLPNGGNVEYLKDGVNCLFYERGDYEDGAKQIEKIVEDKKLRKKLREGAEKVVVERDWKNLEDKVVELYE